MTLCRLRGRILPLVFLDAELQMKQPFGCVPLPESAGQAQIVVVLQACDRHFGLVVDQVHDTEEVVVKPLGKHLKGVPIYAGATILGDGRAALILDVAGLARRASVVPDVKASNPARTELVQERVDPESETLLVLEGPNEERVAIPLSEVTRLEEFPRSAVETTGNREVVQYRDEILPLVRIQELPGSGREPQACAKERTATENFQVVVCTGNGNAFGLVVNRIFDVVEHNIGKLGLSYYSAETVSAVIQGRVTRILDLEALRESAWQLVPVPVEMEA